MGLTSPFYRVRTLLRFAYAHVQMMLYRPFLHYISPRLSAGQAVDDRYYACAAAGISVSRNILHISTEIKNQALVVGPFWSMLYTEFFAILALVFYVLENPDKQGSVEIYADANAGRETMAKMASRSLAADRITSSLNTLWENLPESIRNGKTRTLASKKRSAPGPKSNPIPISTHKTSVSSSKVPSTASRITVRQRPSFDHTHRTSSQSIFTSSSNYPEIHALDVSSGAPSDVSGGTPSSAHRYSRQGNSGQTMDSPNLYKLDALMFPSGDPFAYPNQPLADLSGPMSAHTETNPSHISAVHGGHQTDSRNFYMPGIYGDIERQLSELREFNYLRVYLYILMFVLQWDLFRHTLCHPTTVRTDWTYRHKCTSHRNRHRPSMVATAIIRSNSSTSTTEWAGRWTI